MHVMFTSRRSVTVGPVFTPDTPKAAIAEHFIHGVEQLVTNSLVAEQSPFIRELVSTLRSLGESTPSNIPFMARPSTPIEQELATAVTISMTYVPLPQSNPE
jgi:hypothetical protein